MLEITINMIGESTRELSVVHIRNIRRLKANLCEYEVVSLPNGRSTTFKHNHNEDLFVCIKLAMQALLRNGIKSQRYIPESGYLQLEGYGPCITMELFDKYHTEAEREQFNKFMTGQTSCEYQGKSAIYVGDYERWIAEGRQNKQGSNWD